MKYAACKDAITCWVLVSPFSGAAGVLTAIAMNTPDALKINDCAALSDFVQPKRRNLWQA